MFKERKSQNLTKKEDNPEDTQLNLYAEFDKADKLDQLDKPAQADKPAQVARENEPYDFETATANFKKALELSEIRLKERKDKIALERYSNLAGKSFKEIMAEAKKEEEETLEKLRQTRQEIKQGIESESEYPEKPITSDDDFIEPYTPSEEYYRRFK